MGGDEPTSLSSRNESRVWQFFLLGLASVVAISFFDFAGTGDVGVWHNWITATTQHGVIPGYTVAHTDYPPLSVSMLRLSSYVAHSLGSDEFTGLKVSLAIFLCLSSIAMYVHTRSLLLTTAFQLAITPNSMMLAYLDVYYTPTLVLAFTMLRRSKFTAFAILYTLSFMIKWQSVVIFPFTWVYVLRAQSADGLAVGLRRFSKSVLLPTAAIVIPILGLYGFEMGHSFGRALTHPYLSAYAMNLNWAITHVLHVLQPAKYGPLKYDLSEIVMQASPGFALLARFLFVSAFLGALFLAVTRKNTYENAIITSLLGFLAYFTFNLGVHENHLYVASTLVFLLYVEDRRRVAIAAFIILYSNLNLFLFYGVDGLAPRVRTIRGVETSFIGSVVFSVFIFALFASEIVPHARAVWQARVARRPAAA